MNGRWRRLASIAGAVFMAALLLPDPNAEAASTRLTAMASAGRGGLVLVQAQLMTADGKPLASETVSLVMGNDFLGGRPANLGTEKTDSSGMATFVYEPTSTGEQKLEVRFAGRGEFEKVAAPAPYKVSALPAAAGGHKFNGATPLSVVWRLVGYAAALVTISIWAILIGTLLWVRSGIRRLSLRPGPAVGTRHD